MKETATGELQLFYGTGNSNWDVALYVPYSRTSRVWWLSAGDHLHSVCRRHTTDTAGFDTWSVAECGTLVPEPSSALLVSLGGLIGLLRRRR